MKYSQKLDEIEARFEELTRQMADPSVIADGDTTVDEVLRVTKGDRVTAEIEKRENRQGKRFGFP